MDITAELAKQGILGIIIVGLCGVVYRQYKDGKALQGKFDAMQEARLVDAKSTVDKVTQPLQSISQTVSLMYDKLKLSKEV